MENTKMEAMKILTDLEKKIIKSGIYSKQISNEEIAIARKAAENIDPTNFNLNESDTEFLMSVSEFTRKLIV